MSKHFKELLQHILDECNFIQNVILPDKSKEDFLDDETLKRAIVRSIEIIGEATKSIPEDIRLQWKDIQWKKMAGMRDKLIHDYFGINYSIIWDIVKNNIPELTVQIENLLKDLKINNN